MKNIPLASFFVRHWMLVLFTAFTNWLTLTQHHFAFLGAWEHDDWRGWEWHTKTPFEAFGAILYVPPFCSVVFLGAMFLIHLRYRQTIDADAAAGQDKLDWQQCTPYQRVLVRNLVFVGILIALCILCSSLARGTEVPFVDEPGRWKAAKLEPKASIALDVTLSLYQRTKPRYETIQAMKPNGVPAPILFCLHYRESDNNFRAHAHEGSPLTHRTRDVPKGRPVQPEPPYTFEQSAFDAYYVCEKPPLDKIDWKDMQAALDKMESFNGFGYRRRGVCAPYLWAGTTIYKGGKYVRDGVFSSTAFDKQLGCAAILKRMEARGIAISFAR